MLHAWGFGVAPAHPRDPRSDSLLRSRGRHNVFAASRGAPGGTRAVAGLVDRQVVFFTIYYSFTILIIQVRL